MLTSKEISEYSCESEALALPTQVVSSSKRRTSRAIRYHRIPQEKIDVSKIRTRMHLTQDQFAQFIGKSVYTVRRWEQGQAQPGRTTFIFLFVLATLVGLKRPTR